MLPSQLHKVVYGNRMLYSINLPLYCTLCLSQLIKNELTLEQIMERCNFLLPLWILETVNDKIKIYIIMDSFTHSLWLLPGTCMSENNKNRKPFAYFFGCT